MPKLHEIQPLLGRASPRNWIIKLHKDLFTIENNIVRYAAHYPTELSDLELLVLALEDRRFFRHIGFDLVSAVREIVRAATFQKHGGASTIDMQFVRTATGYRKKTLTRKLYEALLALIVQYRHNKIVILRSYLNCAFFGSHLYGLRKVAKAVFDKDPTQLSFDESAFIAAMLVYPRPMRPSERWRSAVERRASYGKMVYVSNKDSLKKLPGGETL
jgi:membrane carboxypeptidase/penicillin-binding protein